MSSPPVAVRCFSHLGVTVSDLAASIDFYTRVLGFVRRYEDVRKGWTRVGLAMGNMVVELFSPRPAATPEQPFDPFYPTSFGRPKIALTVADVAATYERLGAARITPKCPIVSTSMSRFFFIADPDGTPIQLHEFSGG